MAKKAWKTSESSIQFSPDHLSLTRDSIRHNVRPDEIDTVSVSDSSHTVIFTKVGIFWMDNEEFDQMVLMDWLEERRVKVDKW